MTYFHLTLEPRRSDKQLRSALSLVMLAYCTDSSLEAMKTLGIQLARFSIAAMNLLDDFRS
uniref:Uncharacterized protein n=1 Tax=Anguilla anguilla TaxID=7936 RepID=A0A0E9TJP8_ANGAN